MTTTKISARPEWFPVALTLCPGLVLLVLLATPARPKVMEFTSNNWGSLASLWGLGVSIYVISIATGARRAAQEARLGERTRTALQELEHAAEKNTQLGLYARSAKWDGVQIRAEEVMNCCRTTVARWSEDPNFKTSCDDLLIVAAEMHSVILESSKSNARTPNIIGAQVTASEKLSGVIGRIKKGHDSRSD